MKRLRRVFAYAIALSIVLCGTMGINNAPADKQSFAYAAEETIELPNGMIFSNRIRNGKAVSGELTLISYTGSSADIVIPLKIDGFTVTAIGDNVFKDDQVIRSVTLPDTINFFGESVFQSSSLTSINIPKSLLIIPDHTFNDCAGLETVIFHDDIVMIGKTAFKNTSIEVPRRLVNRFYQDIDNSEASCNREENGWNISFFTDMETGDLYAKINTYVGEDTDIVIPERVYGVKVRFLGSSIFKASSKFTSIVFPDIVRSFPFDFKNHTELKSIIFMSDSIGSVGNLSHTGIEEIVLPGVETVSGSAFAGCGSLRKVTFTGNAESLYIGSYAFKDCIELGNIIFHEKSVPITIDRYAFDGSGVNVIELNGNSEIGQYAFNNCSDLTSLILNGDSHIGLLAFQDCNSLKTIVSDGILKLERNTFNGCKALESITLDTSRTIQGRAFDGCTSLMNIGSEPAFDSETGDLRADIKDFVLENFYNADDVGFLNQYVKAQAEKVVREYTDDSMSDMQKIKILHDWVCNNTEYNPIDVNAPESHNDVSVFLNEYAVCEGYAKALNLLLNTAGIETYYVHSSDHAWNVVRLGGHYFHVDTTWDDGDTISYDWFLKSDSELRAAGGSHEKWSLFTPSSLHSFQGSVLPQCEYRMGDLNTDGSVDGDDLRLLQDYILGKAPVTADDIVLADLNHDGVTDVFDLISMRRLINEK